MAETWTINYEPADGGRFTGKLTVDDEKLTFVSLYDSSNAVIVKSIAGVVGGLVATGGHAAYVSNNDAEMTVSLPRTEIEKTTVKSKLLAKRVIVTMKNGQAFAFNYGMLSVTKLAAAIG
jgi:hypothetical protein